MRWSDSAASEDNEIDGCSSDCSNGEETRDKCDGEIEVGREASAGGLGSVFRSA